MRRAVPAVVTEEAVALVVVVVVVTRRWTEARTAEAYSPVSTRTVSPIIPQAYSGVTMKNHTLKRAW